MLSVQPRPAGAPACALHLGRGVPKEVRAPRTHKMAKSMAAGLGLFVIKSFQKAKARVLRRSSGDPPSMAQTAMRGPLTATGSGKPLTAEELEACREELEEIKAKYGLKEPERAHMDEEGIKWRYGGKPDYSLTNLLYLKGKTKNHPEGSLELIVENLVKTWEMERSHKVDPDQHRSVDPEKFMIAANGWKKFNNKEANEVGNYNVLLAGCPASLYDADSITWEQSHDKFHDAFAAFPWEVLEVFSGPPRVAFSWRHWGEFTGTYDGNKGSGELVELFGFGVASVDDQLRLVDVDIFYKPEIFLEVLKGSKSAEELAGGSDLLGPGSVAGCPHLSNLQK
ncbi:unnamed protein product [Symbiodinium natans]|uniref:Pathogen-related protein n=1 Tax=Symbiodinium natans TaxID=878477 RepID=A0A812USP2_9DINO|nr:unnamed protein product [Symbiodinium natans]